MQNPFAKIIFIFVLCILNILFSQKVFAQTQNIALLEQADSLFAEKQYTESINLYEQLYQQAEEASPAMLLRMAFIQEGLGEFSQALYYLNEYYLMTSDDTVLEKIGNLSEEYDLRGYEFSDIDYIQGFLKKYQYIFILVLIGLVMSAMIYYVLQVRKRNTRPFGFGISYLLILAMLFYLTNFPILPAYGIIVDSNAYIMKAPSAGADVLSVSMKGHRVRVSGQQDIWAKIEWDGEPAYIRQDNLRLLSW